MSSKLFAKLRSREQSRVEQAEAAGLEAGRVFAALVQDCAGAKPPTPAKVEAALVKLGRSAGDLEAAVERLQRVRDSAAAASAYAAVESRLAAARLEQQRLDLERLRWEKQQKAKIGRAAQAQTALERDLVPVRAAWVRALDGAPHELVAEAAKARREFTAAEAAVAAAIRLLRHAEGTAATDRLSPGQHAVTVAAAGGLDLEQAQAALAAAGERLEAARAAVLARAGEQLDHA